MDWELLRYTMSDTSPFKQVHFPGSSGKATTAGKAPSCFFLGINPPETPMGAFCREGCRTKQVFFIPLTLFSVLDSVVLPVLQKIVSFSRSSLLPVKIHFHKLQPPCQADRTVRHKDPNPKVPRPTGRINCTYMYEAMLRVRCSTGQCGGLLGVSHVCHVECCRTEQYRPFN